MHRNITLLIAFLFSATWGLGTSTALAQESLEGYWEAGIDCPGGMIEFGIELKESTGESGKSNWEGFLVNGQEKIPVPQVEVSVNGIKLSIDHYDSVLTLDAVYDQNGFAVLRGGWKKRRGKDKWVTMAAEAVKRSLKPADQTVGKPFVGNWDVKFSSSDDPAVGKFSIGKNHHVHGTFLTTTGDYRFLAGNVKDGELSLSCFDGAHAFLFKAKLDSPDSPKTMKGDFWSSKTWHETFTAEFNQNAKLPDSFKQTLVNQVVKLSDLEFPNVAGEPLNLDDDQFKGKARIIYVFGSWCPNCHDAAAYFSQLDKKYKDQGLSILGVAFEHTGDFERDAEQVKKYLARHDCTYPVVIAGLSDKRTATKTFPLLDRIRSYPTSIFIDKQGKIVAVHTGFTGPATGEAFTQLQKEFEGHIESMLK